MLSFELGPGWGLSERALALSHLNERAPGAHSGPAGLPPPFAAAAEPPMGGDLAAEALTRLVVASLEDDKAEEIAVIDIRGKSSVADALIVASGRSQRHVGALADHVLQKLREHGARDVRVEGLPHCDWVLVDAGDLVVHLFRPEVRSFYNIEKIWGAPAPAAPAPLAAD